MNADVPLKVTYVHNRNDFDYHRWEFVRMTKVDRRGRPNPRMYDADWQFWVCNNPDCGAQAFVANDTIRAMLDARIDTDDGTGTTAEPWSPR